MPNEVWYFAAVVRGSNPLCCLVEEVPNRKKRTLMEIIRRRINPLSHIVSDGWGGYVDLHQICARHSVVNHSENFVSPSDNTVHTQNVENLWRCLRRFLSKNGRYAREDLSEYVREFVYRKSFIDPFECLISTIEQQYLVL
jgi:hypothetical protein